jgi:hypothetical protein
MSSGNAMMESGLTSSDLNYFDHGLKQDRKKSFFVFHGKTSKCFRVYHQSLAMARVDRVDRNFDLHLIITIVETMD